MSRCIGCDNILSDNELSAYKFVDDIGNVYFEDMCCSCRESAYSRYKYTSDKEYIFPELEFMDPADTNCCGEES